MPRGRPKKNLDRNVTLEELNKQETTTQTDILNKKFDFSGMATFANIAKLVIEDLIQNNKDKTFFGQFTRENIATYLRNPQSNEKQLRDASILLYNISNYYKRLVDYFSGMSLLAYVVAPIKLDQTKVDKVKFLSKYTDVLDLLETMNIRHEYKKIFETLFVEGVFYGYEYVTKDSYFIQKLPPDYCKVASIEDGIYTIAFNFSYFSSRQYLLEMWGTEFKQKYEAYRADGKLKWQELDSKNTICVKMYENFTFSMIPFIGVFESLFDLQDFKLLKKVKTEIGNYKLMSLQIPFKDGEPEIDMDMIKDFYRQLGGQLPENVGVFLTPVPVKEHQFEKDTADNDRVAEAERDFWSNAGVSQLLFNSEKSSSATIGNSIKTDESIVFGVHRQLERCLNRKLKAVSGTYKFKTVFLDVTHYNIDKFVENLLKSAQYGVPIKMMLAVVNGYSPSDVLNMAFLENDILELHDKYIPLQSSHTQSSDGGRPTSNEGDLSDAGVQTRETDGNNNRA